MRSIIKAFVGLALAVLAIGLVPDAAMAAVKPWQLGFQEAASPIMEWINEFHNLLLILCAAICLLVLGLMIWVVIRYNEKANPTPSKTTHHTMIEVLWTVLPIIVLVIIAIPSLRLLYFERAIPPADITIKATGYQWYWGYEYPDIEGVAFDSIMLTDEERGPEQPRLLAVDNVVVVPVGKIVKVQVTAADVIHAWALPAFGVKIDAVPGRLNEIWFQATREGVYYGQCSELCGRDHAFMPIEVHVVSETEYAAWVEEAKQKYAAHTPTGEDNRVAAASVAAE